MGIQSLPQGTGSGKIKKKIRDLERLIKKPNLSATKKTEAERALDALRLDLGNAKLRGVESKLSKKYHMVRFFERQKAVRALRKSSAGDEQLAAYYYVTMFPRDQKYASIFAKDAAPSSFIDEISAKMKAGELPAGAEGREKALKEATAKKS